MLFNTDTLLSTSPSIYVYMKRGCLEGKKIIIGLNTVEIEYKCYYLDEDFTLFQFNETFGIDATLPKLIKTK